MVVYDLKFGKNRPNFIGLGYPYSTMDETNPITDPADLVNEPIIELHTNRQQNNLMHRVKLYIWLPKYPHISASVEFYAIVFKINPPRQITPKYHQVAEKPAVAQFDPFVIYPSPASIN
jgi:hypothetical protein